MVTLTDADLMIASREERRSSTGTWIKCLFGGGGITYTYELSIDSQSLATTLSEVKPCDDPSAPVECAEEFRGPAKPMPPAAVSLGEKSRAEVWITVSSKTNHIYSGKVAITASANGKD